MAVVPFVLRQAAQIRAGGAAELKRKIRLVLPMIARLPMAMVGYPIAVVMLAAIRFARPVCLVRIETIAGWRIGHFAGNLELYLCELDAGINRPAGRFIDLWYHPCPPVNRQLDCMMRRHIRVWPRWLMEPLRILNDVVPGGEIHRVGNNTNFDRDVHNLMDRTPPHLAFLADEEERGQQGLRALGIPAGAPFVCLNVRDSAYLTDQSTRDHQRVDWSYHDYRNCRIENYVPAAEALASRGYYVIRMGALVKTAMPSSHPMIIDYAANGMRTEFMDIYLGARCAFCISNGSGFDAVPYIFRRPIVYVDMVPIGVTCTFSAQFLTTTKKLWLRRENRFMGLVEMFATGAAYFYRTQEYEQYGLELVESDPEEVTEVVLEMASRLDGSWRSTDEDEARQHRFWQLFPRTASHGELRSRIGARFLRRHASWLEGDLATSAPRSQPS